ncbi:MAG: hypothetical protein ACD_46C00712G0013 [uncultured bacterium]|nr:MAG: hypothetical protein ACD_46C00712G0013 [uncultured bacterium]
MKSLVTIVGILLIILGIAGFASKYFSYTTEEKIAEIGTVKITDQQENTVFISPLYSGLVLAAGVILVVVGSRKF